MAKKAGKKGPNRSEQYFPGAAPQKFQQGWDETMRATYERSSRQAAATVGMPTTHPGFKAVLEYEKNRITALFALKRQLQRQIFDALRESLPDRADLIDLMSGDATATLPLVACGKVGQLTLVDNRTSPTLEENAEIVARRLNISGRVRHLNFNIGGGGPELPNSPYAVLAETGLAVPAEHRFPPAEHLSEAEIQHPPAFRSSHIVRGSVGMGDVFDALGHVPGRLLHVFETPFYRQEIDTDVSRDFVQGVIDDRPEWKITEWGATKDGSPMAHGILRHE